MNLRGWLRERVGSQAPHPATVPGVSFAYVFGWVLVMLLGVQVITGVALSMFYSPSTTDAWASVAYVQDRMPGGWLIRGLHYHGASALVIVAGVHLLQTALFGAYKKPRELTWWLGIVLLLLVLAFAITGYVLRWDQAGYWANQVEVGIAAGTPVVGGAIKQMLLGGNEYGNLTLTRFYTLHVILLPALTTLVVIFHIVLARRHGTTPRWDKSDAVATPRWPAQTLRDVIAMALVFAVLLVYTAATSGVDLAAPADPGSAYDARPLWYFRWLFELRHIFGSLEQFVAMVAPALVAGFLVMLPLVDRSPFYDPGTRKMWLGILVGILTLIGLLTLLSFAADSGDDELAKRQEFAAKRAEQARTLAAKSGVPATGPQDLFATSIPMYRARLLYRQRCAGCHDADSPDRKGPIIAPGHHTRAWLKGFLKAPSGDAYWGKTKLAKTEDAMKAVDIEGAELDDLVEVLYAQSGALDVIASKRDRGKAIFEKACTDCHSLDEGIAGGSGPGLAGIGSRDWFTTFIGNPKSPVHMGEAMSEMPRFDKDLSIIDRDALAEYLVWLRTATPQDLDALGEL
ncbi:MAG TPA: cytochrome b N-terminal domain-containing protein [Kofleriaceae bacterium]